MPVPAFDYRARLVRAAAALRSVGCDGLLISHLPNLRYLTGLEATAGAALLTADGELALLIDPRYEAAASECAAAVGGGMVRAVPTSDARHLDVAARVCGTAGVTRLMLESRALSLADARQLQLALQQAGWGGDLNESPHDLIEGLRLVKDEAELGVLREAGARLSEVATGVLRDAVASAGRTEQEVAAAIDGRIRQGGFSRVAFDTIVASGPRSAFPHARPTDRRLESGDVVVLDFGGVYGGYCVDLTRTISLGQPSPAADALYQAVSAAQQAAFRAVVPGQSPVDVDRAARQVLEAAGLGDAFGHGTGHGLGLEVHEAPRLGRPRPDTPHSPPLEAGVVCTIEPGAYVVGRVGVRIEDDVAVTAAGHERLTEVPAGWPSAH